MDDKILTEDKYDGDFSIDHRGGKERPRSKGEQYYVKKYYEQKEKEAEEKRQEYKRKKEEDQMEAEYHKDTEEKAKKDKEQREHDKDALSPDQWEDKYKEKYPYDEELEYMGIYNKYPASIRKDYDDVDNKDIQTIINAVKDIEYGYIDINDDHRETNRDYIHGFAKRTDDNLLNHYRLEVNPINTLVHKIGICGDQTICIKYLINSILDGYECHGYALRKGRFGHAVPGFKTPKGDWYYLENAWDKERGLHGPFKSEKELMDYFDYIYHKHHDKDNNDPVTVERWNCLMEELYCDKNRDLEILNEENKSNMSIEQQNKDYIESHLENIRKAYEWIKEYCPEILENVDKKELEKNIKKHDASKYSKDEFMPYARYFFLGDKEKYQEEFDVAKWHHYRHNPHHPEYWDGKEMPEVYIIEQICDWWTFGWKNNDLNDIFKFNKNNEEKFKKLMHPKSYELLQKHLNTLHRKLSELNII